jgi:TetR/AcrR family transcriptional regulator, transcriptional repressor for nem operon
MNTKTEFTDTRLHLLETGTRLILGKGFSAVGLAEILGTAGVPKGSFYHYFRSKEQFGIELVEHYFTLYLARLEALFQDESLTLTERLMTYWSRWHQLYREGSCEEQCLVVKLSAEVADLSEPMRQVLLAGTQAIVARLADILARASTAGELQLPDTPRAIAEELYQLWLGASLLTKLRRDDSALNAALHSSQRVLGQNVC